MISIERMQLIHDTVDLIGVEEAMKSLGLSRATVIDYLGRYVKRHTDSSKAKVLLFDIETSPMEVYAWNLFPKYIHISQIKKDWNIICWRAKWLFSDEMLGDVLTPLEAIAGLDERITRSLWKLIDEADVLIAHNLINFDRRKANTRFLKHELNPPSSYQLIDTLQVLKKEFRISSNKLDYACQFLDIGAKLGTGFDLWKRCIEDGDPEALTEMYTYCGQDTAILEDLYLRLRPWIKSHPNMALYFEDKEGRCANCGSDNIVLSKPYYTPTGIYQSFRCEDCGAHTRSRHSGKRSKDLLRSVAR